MIVSRMNILKLWHSDIHWSLRIFRSCCCCWKMVRAKMATSMAMVMAVLHFVKAEDVLNILFMVAGTSFSGTPCEKIKFHGVKNVLRFHMSSIGRHLEDTQSHKKWIEENLGGADVTLNVDIEENPPFVVCHATALHLKADIGHSRQHAVDLTTPWPMGKSAYEGAFSLYEGLEIGQQRGFLNLASTYQPSYLPLYHSAILLRIYQSI